MTKAFRMIAAATLAGALGAAGVAAAQSGPGGDSGTRGHGPRGHGPEAIDFTIIDADGDGVLTREELTTRATARIAVIDADGNGLVSREELLATLPKPSALINVFGADPAEEMADRILASFGATAAGEVAVDAMAAEKVNALLTRLDEDRDDALSQAEAEAEKSSRGRHGDGHDWRGRSRT